MEIGDGPPGASVADALQENTIEQRFQYALAKKKNLYPVGTCSISISNRFHWRASSLLEF